MHGPVARLLLAQGFADFADWLDIAVIGALLAFTWTVDPYVFAMLAVAMGLPYLIVGPVAGAVVDRTSLRHVMVVSNLGRGVATLGLAFAPGWQVLLVMVFLRSSVDAFFTPAKQATIQRLTTADNRMRVNGQSHAINQASKVVAPALGGAALIIMAPSAVFALNAFISLIAAGFVMRLPVMAPLPDAATPIKAQISAGARLAWQNITIRRVMVLTMLGYFAMFFSDMLIAPLIRDFGHAPQMFGYVLAAVGAGGVLGALWPVNAQPMRWLAIGACIGAVCIAGLGAASLRGVMLSGTILLPVFAVLGVASAMVVVPTRTILQNATPPADMGRITALNEALSTIALLSAPFIGAAIAGAFGIGAAFVGGALFMGGVAMLALAWRQTGQG